MADYGATDTSTTTLATNQFPVSAVWVPNDALRPLGGGPKQTDSGSKAYSSMLVYVQDGYDVTQGSAGDAANTNSVIGQLKQIKTNTASVTIGSLPAISGTVTANQGGSWTVQANAGTNLNTSALALDTSVNGVIVAQGSTTSGEKGPLIQGAVTTAAPSYTTAQTSPLSLTLAGALRVDASATTQPVSGTFWQATQPISAASLPLPGGAATAAKQPALGTAGTASSDVITVQGIASMTALKVDGSAVTQPVSGTISITANSAVNVAQFGGTNIATGTGAGGAGIPRVTVSNDSNVLATQSGTWTVQPGNTPNTSAWLVQDVVASSGGEVPYHNLSAATTNFTNVKGSACQMYDYVLSNTSASIIFVKFYDKATAPGTGDTPKRTVQVPANGTVLQTIPKGMKFTSGFGWAATGAVADNDNTAIAANCVIDFSLNS